ncbi:unnamed protein product [Heligmosomoides polygyrus]|uniref:nucleoside-diphosphate kinase n=1 Tax=Heligmosomoides polygyrus TaxID=6339 RepID=A0A183FPX4_HELPZ|nr:unnamed protein product [Heligmosomoides polygyrus]
MATGYKLVALKIMTAFKEHLEVHYQDLKDKPFFTHLIKYIGSGPVIAMVWQGIDVVKQGGAMLGATNLLASAPGTIRGRGRLSGRCLRAAVGSGCLELCWQHRRPSPPEPTAIHRRVDPDSIPSSVYSRHPTCDLPIVRLLKINLYLILFVS